MLTTGSATQRLALVVGAFVVNWWVGVGDALAAEYQPPDQPCTISVSPRYAEFGADGGPGTFDINTSIANCPWGAGTVQPWLTITSSATGNGDGSLSYEVAPGELFRQGTIGVAGKATHVVTQNGPAISCSIRQITDTTAGVDHAGFGVVSHDGRWITYGITPGGVYLENLVTSEIITLSDEACYAGNPFVNGDGSLVAYESQCDPVGQNTDGNREIMLYDRLTEQKTQLTHSIEFGNFGPHLTRSGDRVIFRSMNDYTGGNPSPQIQVFMVETAGGPVSQLTSFQGSLFAHRVSADGDFVVVSIDEDLVGSNTDLNEEIYRLEVSSGTLTQLTDTTTGDNWTPSISADGTRVAFFTTSPDLGNHTGSPSLMAHDAVTGVFLDIHDLSGGSGGTSMDADGTRVGVVQASLIGVHDLGTLRSQILAGNGLNSGDVQTNGALFSIRSTADLTGQNPDESIEIFVATCPTPLFADGIEFGGLHRWSHIGGG